MVMFFVLIRFPFDLIQVRFDSNLDTVYLITFFLAAVINKILSHRTTVAVHFCGLMQGMRVHWCNMVY
jgi:hypothetical protein